MHLFGSSSKSPVDLTPASSDASPKVPQESKGDKKHTSPVHSEPKDYEAAFGALEASYGFGSSSTTHTTE
ncbi:hypothetical protein M405DRAFT_818816 [Rhizopogon salebrosus TDB-379]|nr:hypothetical protein M405DRAFT_818816 [Rhizopogon salebrosus TDB-379]